MSLIFCVHERGPVVVVQLDNARLGRRVIVNSGRGRTHAFTIIVGTRPLLKICDTIESMKHEGEMIEGKEAWTRFEKTMKAVIAVPHAEIQRRIQEHKEKAALNPNKRGPKPRVKPSASHGPAA